MMAKRKRVCTNEEENEESQTRYFLDPKSVSCHLYCSICQEVFKDPHRAPCGHSYCRQCIEPWLKQSKTCPEDRQPLSFSAMHHDFILENIIGDQQVACPYRVHGCEYISQLSLLTSHKKQCTFNPANLPTFLKESLISKKITDTIDSDSDDENHIPTPVKPSLKMRLFNSNSSQRDLLRGMFEGQNKKS